MAISGPRLYLTGGTSNLNPNASLGGAACQLYNGSFGTQTADLFEGTIAGVQIADATGNPDFGRLSYNPATGQMIWTPDGDTPYIEVIGSDGLYQVGDGSKHLIVNVTSASLPTQFVEVPVNLTTNRPNLFDDVSYTERGNGRTEYRCLFIKNHSAQSITALNLSITQPGTGSMYLGTDYAGSSNTTLDVGTMEPAAIVWNALLVDWEGDTLNSLTDDSWYFRGLSWVGAPLSAGGGSSQDSNGTSVDLPAVIADETDSTNVLAAVTWGSSLAWSSVAAGKYVSFWIKRVFPNGSQGAEANNQVRLTLTYTGG